MSSLSWNLFSAYPTEFDEFFTRRGFTHTVTNLAFWPITILGGAGFILNLISVMVNEMLARDFSSISMYRFLRIYLINSALVCLVVMFNFVGFSVRVFPWIMTQEALKFYIHFFMVFTNIGYFYSTVLNILITFERVWTLRGGNQLFKTSRVNFICLMALAAVLVISIPNYMYNESASRILYIYIYDKNGTLQKNQSLLWWYGKFTTFSATQTGKVIQICLNVFRDGLLVLVEILISLASIYYLKIYLQKKKTISFSSRPVTSLAHSAQISNQTEANGRKSTRAQANLTIMAFFICFLSFLEHAAVIGSLLLPYTPSFSNVNFNITLCVVSLVRAIKHGSNFIILFIFNSKFRELCLKCIKC